MKEAFKIVSSIEADLLEKVKSSKLEISIQSLDLEKMWEIILKISLMLCIWQWSLKTKTYEYLDEYVIKSWFYYDEGEEVEEHSKSYLK